MFKGTNNLLWKYDGPQWSYNCSQWWTDRVSFCQMALKLYYTNKMSVILCLLKYLYPFPATWSTELEMERFQSAIWELTAHRKNHARTTPAVKVTHRQIENFRWNFKDRRVSFDWWVRYFSMHYLLLLITARGSYCGMFKVAKNVLICSGLCETSNIARSSQIWFRHSSALLYLTNKSHCYKTFRVVVYFFVVSYLKKQAMNSLISRLNEPNENELAAIYFHFVCRESLLMCKQST